MNQKFDYEKYIWQIQFQASGSLTRGHTHNVTIDPVNRYVTIRDTVANAGKVNEQIYEIWEEDYEKLLPYLKIDGIKSFEKKSYEELTGLDCGYRDGLRIRYSYFTHGDPPRTDGVLGEIYEGNPIEGIFGWFQNTYL